MTAFFGVRLVLTAVSLTLGTIIDVLGLRALRAALFEARSAVADATSAATGIR